MFQIEIQNIRKAQFEDKYGIYLQDFVSENEKIPVNEFIEKIKSIFGDVNIKIIWCDENNGNKIHLASEYEWIKNQLYDYKIVVNIDICGLTITLRDPSLSQNKMNESYPSHYEIVDGGKRMTFGEGRAEREPSDGKGRYDLITPFGIHRLAIWYELGSKKYADRNWEKGMPFSRYIDAAKRHLDKYIMGMKDEDHLAAAAWNILSIMHHEELGQMEFDDMPHYLSKKEEK